MDPLLTPWLAPLEPYLQTPDLMEISVIKEKELRLEIAQKGYQTHPTPDLDFHYWACLCQVLANKNGLLFHERDHPRLSTALPAGHRFEALLGKNVSEGLSISIRLKRDVKVQLEEYGLSLKEKELLLSYVKRGCNLIVSGGTSSGKTTFINALIPEIPRDQRILTLEDTRELIVPHENHKHYQVSRHKDEGLTYPQAIDHLMRSRPDVILMGEVSIPNAFPLIRVLNSGHKGFMTTVHANSPQEALQTALPQNIELSGHPSKGIEAFLKANVDLVIQLHKRGYHREVTEIYHPPTQKVLYSTNP